MRNISTLWAQITCHSERLLSPTALTLLWVLGILLRNKIKGLVGIQSLTQMNVPVVGFQEHESWVMMCEEGKNNPLSAGQKFLGAVSIALSRWNLDGRGLSQTLPELSGEGTLSRAILHPAVWGVPSYRQREGKEQLRGVCPVPSEGHPANSQGAPQSPPACGAQCSCSFCIFCTFIPHSKLLSLSPFPTLLDCNQYNFSTMFCIDKNELEYWKI